MAVRSQGSRQGAEDTDIVGETLGPQGASRAGGPADLADFATNLSDAAKAQTRSLLNAAKGQAKGFADERKDGIAQAVADVASSLRDSGEGFADRPNVQGFVGSAADGLDQLASSIRDRSVAELYGEAEDFARRQPLALGLGALAAGFFLARFIKSSADGLSITHAATRAASDRARRARQT